ncbi:circularly permuted type 2 ATP-grasp protein [Synechococcus sp. Tobar12-5m-g]|uniref:circularly permuted type 2 ATP-grasp protein n=1 Tax=unclassified Synechococcus TaxID=2626047 RepID=UPI0020CE4AA7|nr:MULTISPECIES: circularly permuted type 2 ATP-grasp protein [unclassified Synechococcus]MCP9771882.1 circularly permuted type 2 ATP-grasp protein [Synechococcus sp. Tobar12-5m-g]MCP9872824.1 circularly permuted type 2 ATP-grasp protein [Synechococcus sp. Cruz CV-v-12]
MFTDYQPRKGYDEYFNAAAEPRAALRPLLSSLGQLGIEEINRNHAAAGLLLKRLGATFRLNGSGEEGGERILPFDPLPRLIRSGDWDLLETGLIQRLEAIDHFLADVYGDQKILDDGVVPRADVESSHGWRPQMRGFKPPLGRWCHVSGLDLIRDGQGTWRVLEDNLRCPSGVAYFLENRRVMKRMFPSLFAGRTVHPIDDYPSHLLQALRELAPWTDSPTVVLLTPGVFNSAYFEHSFLAQQMGIQLVEGRDLVCEGNRVWMRSTAGLQAVDVIYRRIDDDFLDPAVFRSDSMLGVRGLMEAYRTGRVAIANAPGTGVADDKLIYAYVPDMIRYYLAEEPIIENVPTYICARPEDQAYVLAHLKDLVVKSVGEAGGYGMLIGPHAQPGEILDFAEKIKADPRNFIAQPTLELSTVPSLSEGELYPCHVDLRPYVLRGQGTWVSPGGLTRVALRRGSLVVNSSQGGGCKDTWIVDEAPC